MNAKNQFKIIFYLSLLSIFFLSCVTSYPNYTKEIPEILISNSKEKEILKIISSPSINPYIEPSTVLRGKLNEFFVVRIDFNLEKDTEIKITADMNSLKDKKTVAYLYEREQFLAYWEGFLSHDSIEDNLQYTKKTNSIRKTCFPEFSFLQKAGRSVLYLPFIGKNPIERPTEVYVQVTAGSREPFIYKHILE